MVVFAASLSCWRWPCRCQQGIVERQSKHRGSKRVQQRQHTCIDSTAKKRHYFLSSDSIFTGCFRRHCTALFSTGTLRQYMCFLDGTQLGAKLKAERRLVLEPKTCITPSLIISPLKRHAVAAHAPRSYRRTPLYMAVETGNADIVSALLAAGAEVDAENKCVCPAVLVLRAPPFYEHNLPAGTTARICTPRQSKAAPVL